MNETLVRTWEVEDVLTDVTTAKLSDPTGTYGIKRNDNDEVVVADGTAMTHSSTGVYTYTFTKVAGVAYTAYIEIVYDGVTYHFEEDIAASAADDDATLAVTYAELRREIGQFLGYGHDVDDWSGDTDLAEDVNRILRSGVRRVLTPPILEGEKHSYEWNFLRPVATLTTTAPYTTGTVTIVDGVATISGGTWPSWSTQGALTISTGTYAVSSVSGDELTLVDNTLDADAGTTFSLGRVAYDLPTDFAMVDGPLVYATGQSLYRRPIERYSEYQLLQELTYWTTNGYPRAYAVRPKAIDMTATTKYEMLLCPAADAAYQLLYHYRVAIAPIDDTNSVPPGGEAHGELYLEACLAAAEQKLHDNVGLHTGRFMECLRASISHDRRVACPDTLGPLRDTSDEPIDLEDHRWTCTGLTRYGNYPP